jgi:hypothetical protein
MKANVQKERPTHIGKPYTFGALRTFRMIGSQEFLCVGFKPHRKRDGTETQLAVVKAKCARCRKTFLQDMAVMGARFYPNRRCEAHRRPGLKVGRKKRVAPDVFA